MKVELHLHTSRYSSCAVNTPDEMIARLVEAGYHAAYITEHNEVWSDEELADLQAAFPAIRIFPGMELTIGDSWQEHLVVLGSNDPEYLRIDEMPDVLARAEAQGCLTVLAHPYRFDNGATMLDKGLRPDALEYFTNNHAPENAARSQAVAAAMGLRLVNAGDSHGLSFIDRFWIETAGPLEQAKDIRRIVLAGDYENCRSDNPPQR